MKQTAVEWLVEQMFKQGYFDSNKPLTFTNLDHLQQQAKAMEKEQIMNSWAKGVISEGNMTAEQYYNETFKK
tara:strand:+ start:133 stop:348 length:216 start_codon:yes stop_codon:yes gene_type:complete